jgi:hypothetical protein
MKHSILSLVSLWCPPKSSHRGMYLHSSVPWVSGQSQGRPSLEVAGGKSSGRSGIRGRSAPDDKAEGSASHQHHLKRETSIEETAIQHGLTVAEIGNWQERFFPGAENALRVRPKEEEALKDKQIKKLKQKIGDMLWTSISCGR